MRRLRRRFYRAGYRIKLLEEPSFAVADKEILNSLYFWQFPSLIPPRQGMENYIVSVLSFLNSQPAPRLEKNFTSRVDCTASTLWFEWRYICTVLIPSNDIPKTSSTKFALSKNFFMPLEAIANNPKRLRYAQNLRDLSSSPPRRFCLLLYPFRSRNSFASFTLLARYGLPPLSGWLASIRARWFFRIFSFVSVRSLRSRIKDASRLFILGSKPPL